MKKIVLICSALTSLWASSQVNIEQQANSTQDRSFFLDASGYENSLPSVGKGLNFPRTDLTTFSFDTQDLGNFQFSLSAFDGFVVYNTGTGLTGGNATTQGQQMNVSPGFYYFSNPSGNENDNDVASGQWIRIGSGGVTLTSGPSNPTNGTGNEGDFYINTTTNQIFGPYNNGTWPAGTSLVGPEGPAGAPGAPGAPGTNGTNGADGADGLLPAGTAAGNTTYWNGTEWVVNSNNIFNNGAGVGIGTGASPDASAKVEIASTTQGFLPPRMTTAQRNAIAAPAVGLTIFNTTTNCLQWHIGANIWHDGCNENLYQQYPVGSNFCNVQPTAIVDVTNVHTGKTWMDRNLGANRAATSSTDAESYGSLYQWGRLSDGHQCVNRYAGDGVTTSGTTATLSSSDTPGHGDFITTNSSTNDWRSPQNDDLWQGVNGTNNPCPTGYRIPTEAEFNDERLSWTLAPISSTNNAAGAFASPLKLLRAGARSRSSGELFGVDISGYYWSSAVFSTSASPMVFSSNFAGMSTSIRAVGYSVRCIKD